MSNVSTLRPIAVCVAALLLAACAVGPNAVHPTMAVPAQFDSTQSTVGSDAGNSAPATSALESEFWTSLGDAQLSALIVQTLAANHDLRIALSHFDAANALMRGAKLDRLPTVTAFADGSHTELSHDEALANPSDERNVRSYDAGVNLSWELDLFGRVRRNVEAGRADAQASGDDVRAMQVSIVAEVASDYVLLRGLQAQLDVAQRNVVSQSETLHLVESGLKAGRGTPFDTARARAQLETTAARVPALQAQIAITLHHLAVLSGQSPEALQGKFAAAKPLPILPSAVDPGTPGDLLRRRPDIAAAEARLHAATARIGVATADLFPRFTLGGMLGGQGITPGALSHGDSGTNLVALGIDWSFLDVGRVRARIARSNADAEGELARYEQTVLRALEEADNALVTYTNARLEDEHLQHAATDSTQAAQLARVRYQAGAGTLLEVLDAERNSLQAQDALAQGRTRSLEGLIQMYRAMAGGWPNTAPHRERIAKN